MKEFIYSEQKVQLSANSYRNNGTLAVVMTFPNEEELPITVNLNSRFQSDSMAFLDYNNYPGITDFIEKNGLGLPMGFYQESGFCSYPLYTIFTDKF